MYICEDGGGVGGGRSAENKSRKEEHTSSFTSGFVGIAKRAMSSTPKALLNNVSFLRTLKYVGTCCVKKKSQACMHLKIAPRLEHE